ncbi:DUF302 domain-containing protein [bacterium]|jgi:uncharacterized protein (DUF302 family)|nr:DUF302 domain-containing protein [bacterium]
MKPISFDVNLPLPLEAAVEKTTEVLKSEGFGILTRIDFDQKIKEKLGHTLPRTAILGACNPSFAYEGYQKDPRMLLLVPCNVVVEETGTGQSKVRIIRPSAMTECLHSAEMTAMACQIDSILERAAARFQ